MSENEEKILNIPVDKIVPIKDNRKVGGFDEQSLKRLAESIESAGVLQPIIVREGKGKMTGAFQMICGERRLRAMKMLERETIPAIVRDYDDVDVLKVHTIENLHQRTLHPLDEAIDIHRLLTMASYSVSDVAIEIGRSESSVYRRLQLLKLAPKVREKYVKGWFSHAVAAMICRFDIERQTEIADWIDERRGRHFAADTTGADVLEYIRTRIKRNISTVGFDLTDKKLHPSAGACADCPKFGPNQPFLFSEFRVEGETAVCMDPTCLELKLDEFFRKNDQALQAQKADFIYLLSTTWMGEEDALPAGSLRSWEWTENEKSKLLGLICNGIRKGIAVHYDVKEDTVDETDEEKAKREAKEEEYREKEFAMKVTRETNKKIFPKIRAIVRTDFTENEDACLPPEIARMLCMEVAHGNDETAVCKVLKLGDKETTRDWTKAREALRKWLADTNARYLAASMLEIYLAGKMSYDDEEIFSKVCKEVEGVDYEEARKEVKDKLRLKKGK